MKKRPESNVNRRYRLDWIAVLLAIVSIVFGSVAFVFATLSGSVGGVLIGSLAVLIGVFLWWRLAILASENEKL